MTITASPYVARVLPVEEWHRLQGLPLSQGPALDPGMAAVVIVEKESEIIATWAAVTIPHAEGCWIRPEYQHNPAVVAGLVSTFFGMLADMGIPAIVTITSEPKVAALAQHLHGQRLGDLWLIPVPPKET